MSEKGGGQKIKQFRQDLEIAEKRIAEIDSVIVKLFEQNALGKISDERFEKMSSAYENEQKELTQKRDDLKARIIAEEKKTQSTNQFLETIRKYETVTELNRSMLVELIDSIYVYQAEGTGKDRKQKVEINYRFLAGSQCGIAWRQWKNIKIIHNISSFADCDSDLLMIATIKAAQGDLSLLKSIFESIVKIM